MSEVVRNTKENTRNLIVWREGEIDLEIDFEIDLRYRLKNGLRKRHNKRERER